MTSDLPQPDDSIARAARIDQICDAFEASWRSGQQPQIEDCLGQAEPADRDALLLELVPIDIDYRMHRGQRLEAADYVSRFAGLDAAWLEQVIAQQSQKLPWPASPQIGIDSNAPTTGLSTTTSGPRPALRYFGDYELIDEIARGGMGVVFRARQVTLNRVVAVKMILSGQLASPADVQRFHTEAEAAAQLDHPGIVPIYEVGQQDGLHYFSMGFVEGQSLSTRVAAGPLPVREAATLVRSVAEAVQYAHDKGVIHRDLKPSNILIGKDGKPRVTDFGLAKLTESGSDLTGTGQVLGTPGFMPPEQAAAQESAIGRASDIYSLGAVLYCLLTGRPPFQAATAVETLLQVQKQEPPAPHTLNPAIPLDLDTVILKCLDKTPSRRYQSARELADELTRYLDGLPILARRVSRAERFWRWCKREPVVASTGGTAIALLIAVAAVASWAYVREASLRGVIVQEQRATQQSLERESALRQDLQIEQAHTQQALTASQISVADLRTHSGLAAADRGDPAEAALWFASAANLLQPENPRTKENRIRASLYSSFAPRPTNAVMHPEDWVMDVKFHPSGRYLMTWSPKSGPHRGTCVIWDLTTQQPLDISTESGRISCGRWSPDGKILAVGTEQAQLELRQFPDDALLQMLPFEQRVDYVEFDPTGRFMAVAYGERPAVELTDRELRTGKKVRVWDLSNNTFATPELVQPEAVTSLVFHPQGKQLVVGNRNSKLLAFAVPSAKATPLSPTMTMLQFGFSTNVGQHTARPPYINGGRHLIVFPGGGKGAQLWDTETWTTVPLPRPASEVPPAVGTTAVSPDQNTILAGGTGGIVILDAHTLQARTEHETKLRQYVLDVAVSPSGRLALVGQADQIAQLWRLPGGESAAPVIPHGSSVLAVAWADDEKQFATAQRGGLVRVWTLGDEPLESISVGRQGLPAMSGSGQYVASRGTNQGNGRASNTRVYATSDGKPAGPLVATGGPILDAAFSPDEKELAFVASATNTLSLVDWRTAARRGPAIAMPSQPRSVKYRPQGDLIAVLCAGGEIVLVNAQTATITATWSNEVAYPHNNSYVDNGALLFSPGGDAIITYQTDPQVRVWDLATRELRYRVDHHHERCSGAAFSPDGNLLATASRDNAARVWNFGTGKPVSESMLHPDMVYTVQFHPKNDWIITSCRDCQVRVWNWRTGDLVVPPFQHDHEVHTAAFTPDGRWAATASEDATARIWELTTGKPLTPPIPLPAGGLGLQFTPDGQRMAVGGFMDGIELISLDALFQPDLLGAANQLSLAQINSGRTVVSAGGVANLSPTEWFTSWRDFQSYHGELLAKTERLAQRVFPLRERLRPNAEMAAAAATPASTSATASSVSSKWAAEIATHTEAILRNPADAVAYRKRGWAYYNLSDYAKAIDDLDNSIRLNPEDAEAWNDRGVVHGGAGNTERAIADYDEAIRLDARHVNAHNNRGVAFLKMKQFEKSIADFDAALQIDHTFVRALRNRGFAYYNLGNYERTVADYDRAIELDPKVANAFLNRATALAKIGQHKRAIDDYHQAISLDGSNATVQNAIARLLATTPDDALRDGKHALQHAYKACELSQWKNTTYLDTLAAAYAETGNFEKAVQWSTRAVELSAGKEMDRLKDNLAKYKAGRPYVEKRVVNESAPNEN